MRRKQYILKTRKTKKRRVGRPKVITLKKMLGRGVSRPYKDNNRLMLGSGKRSTKQRGGFFPLAAALTAAPAVIDFLGKIIR